MPAEDTIGEKKKKDRRIHERKKKKTEKKKKPESRVFKDLSAFEGAFQLFSKLLFFRLYKPMVVLLKRWQAQFSA